MDHDTKAAFEKLTKTVEKGFAAVAEDLTDIKDRLTAVESKVSGVNRRLDNDAMLRDDLAIPKRVADLEEETFGASRHPKHVPLR